MSARRGFSLLEVLLAAGVLMGAIVVLGELVRVGMRNAAAARDQALAERLCQTKLAQIVAGIEPVAPTSQAAFEEQPGWLWTVETTPLEQPSLVSVRVTVRQDLPENKRPISFSLVRWLYGEAGMAEGGVEGSSPEIPGPAVERPRGLP
jgi:general secretion pathway protein I